MASATCKYSFECRPFGYSKCPLRSAPVWRSTSSTSSCVGTRCIRLMGSFAQQNVRYRSQDDFPVECEGPVVDVLHVHFHPGFEVQMIAPGDGPEAGKPWAQAEAPALPAL